MEVVAKDMTGAVAPVAEEGKPVDNKVEAKPEEKAPDQLAAKYAAFARQQKAIREQQRQVQESRKLFELEKESFKKLQEEANQYKNKFDLLKTNPLDVLEEAGITYDHLTQMMLNGPNVNPEVRNLQRELQNIKKAQEEQKLNAQKAQSDQYDQAKRQIRSDVDSIVNNDPIYETIKATNSMDAVVDLIEMTFKESGNLMSVEQACNEIEEYLVDEAIRLSNLKKIKDKINPPPAPVEEKQVTVQKQQSNTLSNRIVPSTAKPMTTRERRERAIAVFQGKQIT